ncbi:MAG: transposase [Chloroflexi bacterium]|nr:transposase [Chloroflexota bacterium]
MSLVDNRTFKRLYYHVLTHSPTQADIIAFFQPFAAMVQARQLSVKGITTDGSALYPGAIQAVWGELPHQICVFHVSKDLHQAVVRAVAQVRKQLAARQPVLKRGRPRGANRTRAQQRQRLQTKIGDLFEHRHLFVQRELTANEQATLTRITRGQPQLRALRAICDQIYQLFDRRCRTETARAKLATLRKRVQRFKSLRQVLKGLFAAPIEKALTFLDDRLMGATSNAVERSNRRFRKMQQTVYRVRTAAHVRARIALDLFREADAPPRTATLNQLHQQRRRP